MASGFWEPAGDHRPGEDRDQFRAIMEKLNIPMPEAGMAVDVEEALEIAERIGYPVNAFEIGQAYRALREQGG